MDMTLAGTALLMTLLGLAAWQDIRRFRISNVLTLGGAGAALVLSLLPGGHGPAWSLLGLTLGFLCLLPFYALGVMGAGDVKLLAMAGAFTGPAGAVAIALYTLLAGGLMALAVAVGKGRLQQALRNVQAMTVPCLASDGTPATATPVSAGRLPYGVAILLGSLAWWWGAAA
ncbi:MAG: prepilin peptidase [Moraxellaceae bacterium]|jgi:prepilin peptidase CpaA|nr:prepilin peptidase [Moraxellaceae bacterium]